jgi:WXG100 family type VII secretion target
VNFSMKYTHVDGAINQFKNGINQLNDTLSKLTNIIGQFNGGGFQGRCGDNFENLMKRKMSLINQLISTYEKAIQKLEKAKQEMRKADEDLRKRARQI